MDRTLVEKNFQKIVLIKIWNYYQEKELKQNSELEFIKYKLQLKYIDELSDYFNWWNNMTL